MMDIREIIKEIISASPDYMKLEDERDLIQKNIIMRIRKGYITDDRSLKKYLMYIADEDPLTGRRSPGYDLAVTALKDIPFSVWQRVAG